jgi:DNA-binding NarL/FixJ family response regulator
VTSVVIVDDQDLVRSGLRMVLEARGVEVLGEAADGTAALEVVGQEHPDVVLMDIRMAGMDGIEATRRLSTRADAPRVLVLTTYDVDEYVYGALQAGASGFLLKTTPPDRLVDGIKTVAAGEALLAPSLTRRLIEEHVGRPAPTTGVPEVVAALTIREREVLVLMARGQSNNEIAGALFVSEATVKTHVNRILAKLAVTGRVQAVVLAYECGLVRPGTSG